MINRALAIAVLLVSWTGARAGSAPAADLTGQANHPIEIAFTAAKSHADPFNQVDVDVVFTTPGSKSIRVPAFWAGGGVWKARYASPEQGVHEYKTVCTDASDAGLHGASGRVTIEPYTGTNPLYRHGPIRKAADDRHFVHADGAPFFWLGDTWWMGLCDRLPWPGDFQTLTADRVKKGFTVVQIVAGLYPDMDAFDARGRNETGFPWERDYSQIRPEYFDRADLKLSHLVEQGIAPCIVMAWGYHLPWLGVEKMKRHARYVVARYGALPVVWCAAGEVNLPFYREKGFPFGGEKQAQDWEAVIREIRRIDGFQRLITVHPTGLPPLSGRLLYKDPALLDFDMLQTGHGGRDVLAPSMTALKASLAAKPPLPVVNGEVSYEALLGRIPAEIPRLVFWADMLSGAAGHTYGANGIWQLNRRGAPYGKSASGTDYGPIPWDEAMRLPGSGQLGLAKALLMAYPWPRFESHPEWASWVSRKSGSLAWGDWIWFPEGNPLKDAPVAARVFRKTFVVSKEQPVSRATLALAVDDRCHVYLNGRDLGAHAGFTHGLEIEVGPMLHPGKNVLAVRADNAPGPKNANPAGLSCVVEIEHAGGATESIRSDATWKCSRTEPNGWIDGDFSDAAWSAAKVTAKFGEPPWGDQASRPDPYDQPISAGVPDVVRIIYVPSPKPIEIHALSAADDVKASVFDPVSGRRTPLGKPRPDSQGGWRVAPPHDTPGDWVVILEGPKKP